MGKSDFLTSILKYLEKAKDPLLFGGVICVLLIGFILYYYIKGVKRHLAVEIIIYGVLFIAIASVLTGLYLKLNNTTKVIYGKVDYECKPVSDAEVFTSRLRLAKTEQDGSFHFDVSGLNLKNLRLSFLYRGAWIGDTILPLEAFKEELKIGFGDCSPYLRKTITGRVISRKDGIGRKGLTVFLVGYNYSTQTVSNGFFTLNADSIRKSDTSSLELKVTGDYEGTWPLKTFQGTIPVDKKN